MLKHYIAVLVLTIVILVVAGVGLHIAGSPAESRALRYDQIRLRDISRIKGAIEAIYQDNLKLPASLDQLLVVRPKTAQPYLKKLPTDPKNKTAYVYKGGYAATYDLCATFDTSSEDIQKRKTGDRESGSAYLDYLGGDNSHPAGYYCVSYTIPEYLLYDRQNQKSRTQPGLEELYRQSTASAF